MPSADQTSRRMGVSWANFETSSGLVPSFASGVIRQTRMRLSTPAAASRVPSGLKASVYSSFSDSLSVSSRSPVATFHSFTVRSPLALASTLPSGRNASSNTAPLWPSSVRSSLPSVDVPQLDRVVVAAGGQEPAVGAELRGSTGCPCGRGNFFTRSDAVPSADLRKQPRLAEQPRLAGRGDEELAIAAKTRRRSRCRECRSSLRSVVRAIGSDCSSTSPCRAIASTLPSGDRATALIASLGGASSLTCGVTSVVNRPRLRSGPSPPPRSSLEQRRSPPASALLRLPAAFSAPPAPVSTRISRLSSTCPGVMTPPFSPPLSSDVIDCERQLPFAVRVVVAAGAVFGQDRGDVLGEVGTVRGKGDSRTGGRDNQNH